MKTKYPQKTMIKNDMLVRQVDTGYMRRQRIAPAGATNKPQSSIHPLQIAFPLNDYPINIAAQPFTPLVILWFFHDFGIMKPCSSKN